MPTKKICTTEGCNNEIRCKGVCNKHYHVMKKLRRMKPCGCGCGELTAHTYKHGHHTRLFSSEEQSRRGRMNNGDTQRGRGAGKWYVKRAGVHEHRTVAEKMMGRKLTFDDVVHHINGDKRDNRPENLEVMTRAEHVAVHQDDFARGRLEKRLRDLENA